ncbi:MAG: hypothetical protein JWM93_1381 [Frankiales bacterium]|nr:hypothetical protein [Frankiales bacterium]
MFQQIRAERGERGFTLVELLVVIAILGILAGVVVFSVSGITDKGQTAACAAELSTLQTAVQANFAKTGTYAADAPALQTAGFLATQPSWHTVAGAAVTATGACV